MNTPSVSGPVPAEPQTKYRVIAKLGEGGMALVHLAILFGIGGVRKLVVLKSLRPELLPDARMREMFLTEARLAATLSHPNIVQTFEIDVLGGRPVMVMEYMDGQSLWSVLRGERRATIPLPAQLYVLKEVLNGLDYVHNLTALDGTVLELVHRDISPPNIFITYDGHVKVLDFGIAKNVRAMNTETGVIKGKVRYMAPEQFQGSRGLDRRADIFAVGVLLWEALAGKRLWEGLQDVQIMGKVLDGNMPRLNDGARTVPPSLESICRKALCCDRDDRYASAAAMQMALEEAMDELDLVANHRQVGKLVGGMFAEHRSMTTNLLEEQLRKEDCSPKRVGISYENHPEFAEDVAFSAALSGVPTVVAGRKSTWRHRVRSSVFRLGGFIAVALALLLFALATRAPLHRAGDPAQARVDAAWIGVDAMAAPASSMAARAVRVSIKATPARAKLFLDDVLLAGNPYDAELPSDFDQHLLHAEARGYRPQTLKITLGAPVSVNVDLQPAPAVLVPEGMCKPPFYFDRRGIKYFRPQCLK
jgi:serine/threonine protein kinase